MGTDSATKGDHKKKNSFKKKKKNLTNGQQAEVTTEHLNIKNDSFMNPLLNK